MRHLLKATAAAALVCAIAAGPAEAQSRVRFGIGGTGLFPLESGGGTSWGGIGLLSYGPAHGLGFRGDATITGGDDVTRLLVTGDAVYIFETPLSVFHPYLIGGAGIFNANDATEPMVKLGGGLEYHFVERNRGPVLFGEPTLNLIFAGDDGGGTATALQVNLGVKLGG
jgi:hypothetical protein